MSEVEVEEEAPEEAKTYKWRATSEVMLTRREAGLVQGLLNAGIAKVDILRVGMRLLLAKTPAEILEELGLTEVLAHPEEIEIKHYEFYKVKPK